MYGRVWTHASNSFFNTQVLAVAFVELSREDDPKNKDWADLVQTLETRIIVYYFFD